MKIKAIVTAGNHEQYLYWLNQYGLNRNEYKYVHSEEQLMGIHNVEVLRWGEHWKSPLRSSDRLIMIELEYDRMNKP